MCEKELEKRNKKTIISRNEKLTDKVIEVFK
jgi:hypothetical protein